MNEKPKIETIWEAVESPKLKIKVVRIYSKDKDKSFRVGYRFIYLTGRLGFLTSLSREDFLLLYKLKKDTKVNYIEYL